MPYYRERNRSQVEAIGAPSTVPISRSGRFAGYAQGRFDGVPPAATLAPEVTGVGGRCPP